MPTANRCKCLEIIVRTYMIKNGQQGRQTLPHLDLRPQSTENNAYHIKPAIVLELKVVIVTTALLFTISLQPNAAVQ